MLLRQVVENWQRRDLSPFELADALAAICDAHGHSQQELAKLTGKPKIEISRLLKLLDMPPAAQKETPLAERLGKRKLIAIARADEDRQEAVVREVVAQNLTTAETKKLAKDGPYAQRQPDSGSTDDLPAVLHIECLGTADVSQAGG